MARQRKVGQALHTLGRHSAEEGIRSGTIARLWGWMVSKGGKGKAMELKGTGEKGKKMTINEMK